MNFKVGINLLRELKPPQYICSGFIVDDQNVYIAKVASYVSMFKNVIYGGVFHVLEVNV